MTKIPIWTPVGPPVAITTSNSSSSRRVTVALSCRQGNQRLLNKLAQRKLLRPEPFNYINLKPNYRPTLLSVITNAQQTSLTLLLLFFLLSGSIISLEHLYRGIYSQERWREMSRQGRHGLSSLPGLFASRSITPSILFAPRSLSSFILRRSVSFSFYPVIYIVRSVCGSSEPRLCKQSRRDEKQRCCTQNSEAQKPDVI